jgi:hypothetical protein
MSASRPCVSQPRGTIVSSGWYHDSRAFLRCLGGSAMKVERNCWEVAALRAAASRLPWRQARQQTAGKTSD